MELLGKTEPGPQPISCQSGRMEKLVRPSNLSEGNLQTEVTACMSHSLVNVNIEEALVEMFR